VMMSDSEAYDEQSCLSDERAGARRKEAQYYASERDMSIQALILRRA